MFDNWNEIEQSLEKLYKYADGLDNDLKSKILEIISTLDSDGGILKQSDISPQLVELDKEIKFILHSPLHKEFMINAINLVDSVVNTNAIQYNSFPLTRNTIANNVNSEIYKEQISLKFSDLGYKENIVVPIKKIINEAVMTGKGTTSLVNDFKDVFSDVKTTNGRSMSSYIKQVSNDAVNGTNGQIQLYMKEKYGLDKLRYVGSLKETSRPICIHLVDMKQPIPLVEVDKILKEYRGNNQLVTINGKHKKKGSGILSNATLDTFISGVACPNCRHRRLLVR